MPDTSTWLTREQASDLLGLAVNTLMNYERRGILHPEKAFNGRYMREVIVYDPNELVMLPRRRAEVRGMTPGEISARAFRMLEEGRSIRELVIELRITVREAEELKEQWHETGGTELTIAPAAKADLERALGPFETVADLCARVRDRIRELAGAGAVPANEPTP